MDDARLLVGVSALTLLVGWSMKKPVFAIYAQRFSSDEVEEN